MMQSTFITLDRRHNTPGVLVASNSTAQTVQYVICMSQPPSETDVVIVPANPNLEKTGVVGTPPAPSVHVTQKSTGTTIVWNTNWNLVFNLAPEDELWMSASSPVVVWCYTKI